MSVSRRITKLESDLKIMSKERLFNYVFKIILIRFREMWLSRLGLGGVVVKISTGRFPSMLCSRQ